MDMMMTPRKEAVARLSRDRHCPRCDLDKTFGAGLCSRCRGLLPVQMRKGLERVEEEDPAAVFRAIRAAANYFNVHYQSIRKFGGGRKR
jgi:predicted amidophosphoribosyltransferase